MFERQNGRGTRGRGRGGQAGRGDPSRKIFIGGVPRTVSDGEYREYFRSFGELDDCILMRDSGGVCRGFGFVTYREQSDYDDVLQAQLQLRGKKLEPKKAVPSNEVKDDKSEVKVFIGGLAKDVDKSQLDDYFIKYGEIVDSVVMMDVASGKSRGFGFITFADPNAVVELMKNPKFMFCGKEIQCKQAQPASTLNRLNRTRDEGPRYGQRGGSGRGYGYYDDRGSARGYSAPSYATQGAYRGGQSDGAGGYGREKFTDYPDNQAYGSQSNSRRPGQGSFMNNWVERQESSWGGRDQAARNPNNRGGYGADQDRFRPY